MILHIEPVEQARPRATRYGRSIRVYDPPKVSKYKKELYQLAKKLYHGDRVVRRDVAGGKCKTNYNLTHITVKASFRFF